MLARLLTLFGFGFHFGGDDFLRLGGGWRGGGRHGHGLGGLGDHLGLALGLPGKHCVGLSLESLSYKICGTMGCFVVVRSMWRRDRI